MNEKQKTDLVDAFLTIFSVIFLCILGFALEKLGLYQRSWVGIALLFIAGTNVMRIVAWQLYADWFVPWLFTRKKLLKSEVPTNG